MSCTPVTTMAAGPLENSPIAQGLGISTPMECQDTPTSATSHRKSPSTGGGRAWSEAEETYLIETRMHKMPYKHIAAQLKKTELACRLHYHQLSYGGKRRRSRGTSVSSASGTPIERSNSIPPFDQSLQNTPIQRQLPAFSPPRSPESVEVQPMEGIRRATPNNFSHVPILPKPIPASYHAHNPHRNTFASPSSSVSPNSAIEQTKSLRLITENINSFDLAKHGPTDGIDMARLDRIYDAHRLHFWSMIARNYGCNLNPTVLEDAWRKAHGARCEHLPPTPERSPQTSYQSHHRANSSVSTKSDRVPHSAVEQYGPGFTPVNSMSARSSVSSNMAISSILTEDREVTSPGKEKSEKEAMVGGATPESMKA